MIVTETEAATKLCCMCVSGESAVTCAGSECMAWRWFADLRRYHRVCEDTQATVEPERPADMPPDWTFCSYDDVDAAGWVESEAAATLRRKGSCGLVRL
jgi:hypothetical protein